MNIRKKIWISHHLSLGSGKSTTLSASRKLLKCSCWWVQNLFSGLRSLKAQYWWWLCFRGVKNCTCLVLVSWLLLFETRHSFESSGVWGGGDGVFLDAGGCSCFYTLVAIWKIIQKFDFCFAIKVSILGYLFAIYSFWVGKSIGKRSFRIYVYKKRGGRCQVVKKCQLL